MVTSRTLPLLMPATELLRAYASKALTPTQVIDATLERIEHLNPTLNAFVRVMAASATEAAFASSQRWAIGAPQGLLDGVPVAIKDLLLTKGVPTLRGSLAVDENQVWDTDAPVVARLREQGAILIGKTTTSEFGWKGVTDSVRHGITRNPWNQALTPGGSSGGSAVAVSTGMAALAIGTDGGGSIRIPAAFTGTVGFKPTFGRVSAHPPSAVGTIAHQGPITRTVDDAALMMEVIGRRDPRDWYALPTPQLPYWPRRRGSVSAPRVAVLHSLWGLGADDEILAALDAVASALRDAGAKTVVLDPKWPDIRDAFRVHWQAGAGAVLRGLPPDRQERVEPVLLANAREGARVTLADFQRANGAREQFGSTLNLFFEEFDFLLTPSTPMLPFAAGQENPSALPHGHWLEWAHFSYPFNLGRHPAISIPAALSQSGLPIGLQIVGPMYADQAVLGFAAQVESCMDMHSVPLLTPHATDPLE